MKGGRTSERDKNAAQNIMLQLLNGKTVVVYGGKNARYLNDFAITGLLPEWCLSRLLFHIRGRIPIRKVSRISQWIF